MTTSTPTNTTNTNNTPAITREILVLYGSQTGNSESAARELSSLLPAKLTPAKIAEYDGPPLLSLTSRVLTLDDFLEVERARWTGIVIIVTSSYGVGQAPLGARKFREWCDLVLERFGYLPEGSDDPHDERGRKYKALNEREKILKGVKFALLGLGDSHYSTFFRNPTVIEEALTTVGAERIGELGKADASGTGEMEQSKVIDRWIEGIWKDLAKVVAEDYHRKTNGGEFQFEESEELRKEQLERAREETWKLCLEIFPEWKPTNYWGMVGVSLPASAVLIGIFVHLFFYGGKL
ncbi:hypothetical protein ACHAXS_012328 [Conticribra weissflogii]